MISIFGWQISFLTPWALLALPALSAALLAAYLKKDRTDKIIVASTLFLKGFSSVPVNPKKIKLPWRILIELLILALLALAFAGAFKKDRANLKIVLIDNSQSMSEAVTTGQTKLTLAIEQAEKKLNSFSALDNVALYKSSPELKLVSETNSAAARSKLSQIKASPSKDNLQSSIAQLLKKETLDTLAIFSDYTPLFPRESLKDYRLDYHQIKSDRIDNHNISIQGISSFRDQIEVIVVNYSGSNQDFKILLSALDFKDSKLKPVELSNDTLSLGAGNRKTYKFKISTSYPIYQVKVEAKEDAIESDNIAWIDRSEKSAALTIVSPISIYKLGLEKIPNLSLKYFTPEQFEELKDPTGPILFHRYIPKEIPTDKNAFIMPPVGESFLKITEHKESSEITSWKSGSELLKYLKFAKLKLNTFRVIKVPEWADSVMNTATGSVLISGSLNRSSISVYGFELFPFEGKSNAPLSIMTLNLFSWLGASSTSTQYLVGPYLAEESSKIIDLQKEMQASERWLTNGVFSINSKLSAVNFFDETEANIKLDKKLAFAEANFSDLEQTKGESLIYKIALLVLALLLLDELLARIVKSNFSRLRGEKA